MEQPTLFRIGRCADCDDEFPAGLAGAVARRCEPCRTPKARSHCLGCGAQTSRVRRPNGGLAPAPRYCSDDCKPRCAIDGCLRPRRKREWCANHYAVWREHGDPEREPAYTWQDEHLCVVCGLTPESPEWDSPWRKYCSKRCDQLWRKYEGNVPNSIVCAKCGVDVPLVVPVGDRRRRRSDTSFCASCVRHARLDITAAQLADETGAWCRLCDDPVDMTLVSPNRLSATVDHIVPRALGGTDDRTNLQLAHRGCNSAKRHLFVG